MVILGRRVRRSPSHWPIRLKLQFDTTSAMMPCAPPTVARPPVLRIDWKTLAWLVSTYPKHERQKTGCISRIWESDLQKSTLKSASITWETEGGLYLNLSTRANINQGETTIYLDDAGTEHLTLLVIPKCHILLVWQGNEVGEPFLISGHMSRATEIHEPHVLQASDHHLHRMRRSRWLGAEVNEINFRNPALNHATRRSLYNLLHIAIWTSGTRTTMGKTWTVQVSRLKTGVKHSCGKNWAYAGYDNHDENVGRNHCV
jgi:hypothetical protein